MKATRTIADAINAFHVAQCTEVVDTITQANKKAHRATYRAKLKARIMRKTSETM